MSYMLAENEKQIAQEWEKYRGYTVRPLPSTIHYYQHWIASLKSNPACLLYGGTPEIRNLFQDSNIPITMIDRCETMVRAMGNLTNSKLPIASNENFVELNWLEVHQLKNKYDFLIGDDAINMMTWQHFNFFLKSAAQVLNKNGLFICHLLVKPDDKLICKRFTDVVSEYRSGNIKSHYDLASRLNFICFDYETYSMGWQTTIKAISKSRLKRAFHDFDFSELFGLCNSHFTCPPQDEFEELVSHYFSIEEIFYPHEYEYCLFEPIYVLRKKELI